MHDPTQPLSAVALMLSFRAKFDAMKAKGVELAIAFQFGAETFFVGVRKGALTSERGERAPVDVTVTGSPPAVAGLVYGKAPLKELERQGALSVAGDRAALQRFADLWELPPKAG